MLTLILTFLLLTPQPSLAYFRLNAQTVPYLVVPKTRPALRPVLRPVPRSPRGEGGSLGEGGSSSLSSTAASPGSPTLVSTNPALQAFRNDVLSLVNQERKKRGLSSFTRNALLDRSAQAYADDMVKRKFFSHQSPDGTTPETRIRAVGYFAKPCTDCSVTFSYGENIAKGQKDAKTVMTDWMNSKVHRDNILKREFKELGIGYTAGLWVQNFGGVEVRR